MEVLQEGEELLRNEDEKEEESEDTTVYPVEQLIRPHRESQEPDRLTYTKISVQ